MISSIDFFNYILEMFPNLEFQYNKVKQEYGDLFETIFLEDVFSPEIIHLIEEGRDENILYKIFEYFEDVLTWGNEHLINIFTVTVLEILGNDVNLLHKAKKYMGEKTLYLQKKADEELGRNL